MKRHTYNKKRQTTGTIDARSVRKLKWRIAGIGVVLALGLLGVGRLYLPSIVRDYVNEALNRSIVYGGEVGGVRLNLMRGAYSITDVRISKRISNVPVPFFDAERVDFSLQWNALLRGTLVTRIRMTQPKLNFVDGANEEQDQSGAEGSWLEMLQDLSPFRINSAEIRNGSIHFRVLKEGPPADVHLSDLQGSVQNLGNIRDETSPLPARIEASGRAMSQGKFDFKMTLDPFSYRPTFHLTARILGLDVTEINDLALAYGNLDFQHGWLDFVLEMEAVNGRLSGYAKPLFRNLRVLDFDGESMLDPVQYVWEALVGAATTLLENQPRDQFGTLIPFGGDLSDTTTADILATLGNIFRNAFIRAYLPRLEPGSWNNEYLEFKTPEFIDAISYEN